MAGELTVASVAVVGRDDAEVVAPRPRVERRRGVESAADRDLVALRRLGGMLGERWSGRYKTAWE